MAIAQGIQCRGVFFAYESGDSTVIEGGRFCVPVGNSPPWRKGDYLQSAAGAGAEKLFWGNYNYSASEDDRQMFAAAGAPEWEATVEEAKQILARNIASLNRMADAVIASQKLPMSSLLDRGMDGRSTRFKQILSDDEVRQIAGESYGVDARP
jgi:hypothetical protein